MNDSIRNLLFAGMLFFTAAYDSFTLGVSYDEKNKLYPEIDFSGCFVSQVYGKRWMRFGSGALGIGTILSVTAFLVWYRKKQSKETKSILIYNREG
jgi:hypothetical protein